MSEICLFLDIDGVLNSDPWLREVFDRKKKENTKPFKDAYDSASSQLNTEMIQNLNSVVVPLNIPVVISSNWRFAFDIEQISQMLKEKGFLGTVIGSTPTYVDGKRFSEVTLRYEEILQWLRNNSSYKDYVVVDDLSLGNYYGDKTPKKCIDMEENHMVRTDVNYGLTVDKADKLIQLVQKKLKGLRDGNEAV